jgi:hypothetical protein
MMTLVSNSRLMQPWRWTPRVGIVTLVLGRSLTLLLLENVVNVTLPRMPRRSTTCCVSSNGPIREPQCLSCSKKLPQMCVAMDAAPVKTSRPVLSHRKANTFKLTKISCLDELGSVRRDGTTGTENQTCGCRSGTSRPQSMQHCPASQSQTIESIREIARKRRVREWHDDHHAASRAWSDISNSMHTTPPNHKFINMLKKCSQTPTFLSVA